MREDRYLRRVIRLLWIGLVLAAVWAGARWVLPWLAPFLVVLHANTGMSIMMPIAAITAYSVTRRGAKS